MKTKKVFIIEEILCILINLIFLPLTLLYIIFYYINQALESILDLRDYCINYMSHKLFLHCDEKDVVKNKTIYNKMSTKALYQFLKEIKQNEHNKK